LVLLILSNKTRLNVRIVMMTKASSIITLMAILVIVYVACILDHHNYNVEFNVFDMFYSFEDLLDLLRELRK